MNDSGDHPEQLDELGLEQLCQTIDRALYYKRLDEAHRAAQQLLEAMPKSTTAHELWGDTLRAQGKLEAAAEAFGEALELEPANADAERKYATVTLTLQEGKWQREALESGALHEFRGASNKDPGAAVARSAFFTGWGQLYNGEYEKGAIMAGVGLLLLIGAFQQVFAWIVPGGAASAAGTLLGWLGLVGYPILYVYGIYDAYRSCQQIVTNHHSVKSRTESKKAD